MLLVLASGGDPGDELATLSPFHNSVSITVLTNDDPNGRFAFSTQTQEQSVAEDFLPGAENSTVAWFEVERQQGLLGDTEVKMTSLLSSVDSLVCYYLQRNYTKEQRNRAQ